MQSKRFFLFGAIIEIIAATAQITTKKKHKKNIRSIILYNINSIAIALAGEANISSILSVLPAYLSLSLDYACTW